VAAGHHVSWLFLFRLLLVTLLEADFEYLACSSSFRPMLVASFGRGWSGFPVAATALGNPDGPVLLLAFTGATVGGFFGITVGTSSRLDGLVRGRVPWLPWFWRLAGGVLMLVSGTVRLVQHSADWPFVGPFQLGIGAVLVLTGLRTYWPPNELRRRPVRPVRPA
jgi:hypothetical protein